MLGISSSITKSDRRKWCLARINLLMTASRICGKTTLFTLGAIHLKNWCNTNMFTSHWLLTFWCCLALRARCGSRWSRVSISSPSFSLLSYSWKHFQPKEKKKKELHTSSFCLIQDILGCSKYLEDWPGTPYQWPPSPEREHTCNSETQPLPGSGAWAGGIFWTSPALHQSQSWTPPAAALDGSTRGPLPLRYWPAEGPQVQKTDAMFSFPDCWHLLLMHSAVFWYPLSAAAWWSHFWGRWGPAVTVWPTLQFFSCHIVQMPQYMWRHQDGPSH